jgi:hypothetical protein
LAGWSLEKEQSWFFWNGSFVTQQNWRLLMDAKSRENMLKLLHQEMEFTDFLILYFSCELKEFGKLLYFI